MSMSTNYGKYGLWHISCPRSTIFSFCNWKLFVEDLKRELKKSICASKDGDIS